MEKTFKKEIFFGIVGIAVAFLMIFVGIYALKIMPLSITTKVKPGIYLKIEMSKVNPTSAGFDNATGWTTILQNKGTEVLGQDIVRVIQNGNELYFSGGIFTDIHSSQHIYFRITNLTETTDVNETEYQQGPALNAYFIDNNGVDCYPSYGVQNIQNKSGATEHSKIFSVVANTIVVNTQYRFNLRLELENYVEEEYNVEQNLTNVTSTNNFSSKAVYNHDFETTLLANNSANGVAITSVQVITGETSTTLTESAITYEFDGITGKFTLHKQVLAYVNNEVAVARTDITRILITATTKPAQVSLSFNDQTTSGATVSVNNKIIANNFSRAVNTGEDIVALITSQYNLGILMKIGGRASDAFRFSNNVLTIFKNALSGDVVVTIRSSVNVTVNLYEGTNATTSGSHTFSGVGPQTIVVGNEDLPVTMDYSVPAEISVSGTYSSITYTPTITAGNIWTQANLSITPTSNCTVDIRLNPWIYGQYTATGTATDTATIWAGYYYLQFANSDDRWIIIGESANIYNFESNDLLPSSSPALLDETNSITITAGSGVTLANRVASPNIKPKTRMFQELTGNQVLLYKETTVLDTQVFNATANSGDNKWSASDLRDVLNNGYYNSTTNLNLYDAYIANTELYSVYTTVSSSGVWNYNGTTTDANSPTYISQRMLTKSTEKIFVLSSLTGYENVYSGNSKDYRLLSHEYGGASGNGCGVLENGLELAEFNRSTTERNYYKTTSTYSGYEVYIMQNFNIEMYLGGYTHNSPATNKKIYYFSSDNQHNGNVPAPAEGTSNNADYLWLRSGSAYSYNTAFGVSYVGYVGDNSVTNPGLGVRPAFVLNLA